MCINRLLFSCFLSAIIIVHNPLALASAKKPNITLNKNEHRMLKQAQQALSIDNLPLAEELLLDFNQKKISKAARALSQQMLGKVYQTQLDYPKALIAYEKALSYNKLPLSTKVTLFEQVHKLSYYVKNWEKSVYWWLKWEKRTKPIADDYLLLSNAYKHQKQWKKARQALLKAIKLSAKVPQNWYILLLDYEAKLFKADKQIPLLKTLVTSYSNNERYWLMLAQAYQKNNQLERVADVLYSAYLIKALKSKAHVYWLANHFALQNNLMLAAQILIESNVVHGVELDLQAKNSIVQYLYKAKAYENALLFVESNIDQEFDGQSWLAKLYFSMEHWQLAYEKASALSLHDGASDQQLELIMGLSSLHLENKLQAEMHFKNVLQQDKSNSVALHWLQSLAR